MREELCKAKTELSQVREELVHSSAQKEKISSQVLLFADKTFHFDTEVHMRPSGVFFSFLTHFDSLQSDVLVQSCNLNNPP